jgi:hypothetical protein
MLRRGSFSSSFCLSRSALRAAGASAHTRNLFESRSAPTLSTSSHPLCSFSVPTAAALWAAQRCVIDGPVLTVVDDVLLSDLTWTSMTGAFPGKVHEPVVAGAAPQFHITTGHRLLGLLPVRTRTNRVYTDARWVPFIIDTGSPATYFTKATADALNLTTVDHIEIFDKGVIYRASGLRFDDINLLGTDFLEHCILHVDYPTQSNTYLKVSKSASPAEFIVRDGRSSFRVTPSHPDVMSLKKAIKVERAPRLDHIAADEIVVKGQRDGAALGDEDDLRVGVKYFFEAPPKQ